MAKTTRQDEKKGKEPTPIAVMEPPEAEEIPEDPPERVPAADEPDPEPHATVTEVAGDKEISRRRGNQQYKKAPSVGFIARLTQFEKTEWETQLLLYIYRLAPITDRLATGNQVKYIARFTEPIDEDTIMKDRLWGGSGKYRLTLNRKDPETGKSSCIDQAEIEIEHPEYPPVVPPGEWVDDPRNKRWAWARKPGDNPNQPAQQQTQQQQPAGPSIKDLIDGVKSLKELSKEAAPVVVDAVAQLNGTVDAVSKIITMAKPAPVEKTEDTMQAFLLTELSAERASNRELMGKLLDRANAPAAAATPPPPDPLATMAIKLLEKRLEKMDEKPEAETAAERQSRMNGTQELIAEITKAAAPVLEKAFGLFAVMAASKQQPQQQQRPATQQTVTVAAQPQTPAEPPAQQQTESAAPAAASEQPPAQPTQPTMEQAQQQILNIVLGQATPTLQQYLETGADEDSSAGSNFAAWFCDTAFTLPGVPPPFNRITGVDAHAFAKQFGRTAILEAYKKNPSLFSQIAPNSEAEEVFGRFLDDFLKYDPEAE